MQLRSKRAPFRPRFPRRSTGIPAARIASSRMRETLRGPVGVLSILVAAQWIAIAIFTTKVNHNGWLFFQGGDQTFFYTSAWAFVHGHISGSEISYAWPYVLAPFAALSGPDILRALPAIMLLQVVVLLPIALACVYAIAARIGGRALGYFAAVVWVFGPFAAIPMWDSQYHDRYVEQFLPQALGLSGLADCVSAVALLVAAYLVVRAMDSGVAVDAAIAGLAAGFAIGIKPANALFLPAPVVALAIARRYRQLVPFGAALGPAALTLLLWKLKGLGSVPLFPNAQAVAAGAGMVAAPPVASIGHYVHFDYGRLHENYLSLREYFWSVRFLQWLPIAGVVGVARRTPPIAALLGVWLLSFVVFKGSAEQASVQEGTFLRLFLPAMPAFALLAFGVPLLWPRLRRLPARPLSRPVFENWRTPAFLASVVFFAAVPLVLVTIMRPLRAPSVAKISSSNTFVPVADFGLTAQREATGAVRIYWRSQASAATNTFYTVYRERSRYPIPKGSPPFPIVHRGMFCQSIRHAGEHCSIEMIRIATTRDLTYAEGPPQGAWTYRVAVTANWLDNLDLGDPLVISEPLSVVIR